MDDRWLAALVEGQATAAQVEKFTGAAKAGRGAFMQISAGRNVEENSTSNMKTMVKNILLPLLQRFHNQTLIQEFLKEEFFVFQETAVK
ncbi:hypothetical protein TWF506_004760 [Arthrobotrys conoides]|uniref:Uncharacterized protein n=1 Tax=Arthrobotrys conoides TaxID=74498 RepID=A0AAN8RTC2_9PEZI